MPTYIYDPLPHSCSGLRTKQTWLANRPLFGLAIMANTSDSRPTMIANEPTMIAKGLQTACVAHSGCEWRNAQEIKAVAE